MALSIGSHVWLRQLGKEGVISACNKDGTFSVSIGSLILRCKAEEIEKLSPSKLKKKEQASARQATGSSARRRTLSLDLHGMTVAEAIEALEQCISDAVMSGADEVEVLHGLGSGKLKQASHKFLATCRVVRAFRLMDSNPGTTMVYL